MSTPKKYELLKRHILRLCPEHTRREVIFFGPERRQDCMKVAVSNVETIDIERIQRDLRGCRVFVRSNPRGGSRIDIYVPCKRAPLIVRRALVAIALASWATLAYMCMIVRVRLADKSVGP